MRPNYYKLKGWWTKLPIRLLFIEAHEQSNCEKPNEFEKLSSENSRHTSERELKEAWGSTKEFKVFFSFCWLNAPSERINRSAEKFFTAQLRYQIKPSKNSFSWVNFWNTIRLDAWREINFFWGYVCFSYPIITIFCWV